MKHRTFVRVRRRQHALPGVARGGRARLEAVPATPELLFVLVLHRVRERVRRERRRDTLAVHARGDGVAHARAVQLGAVPAAAARRRRVARKRAPVVPHPDVPLVAHAVVQVGIPVAVRVTRVHARLERLAHRPRVCLGARAVPPVGALASVLALARRAVAARRRLRLAAEPGRALAPVPVRPATGALHARALVVRAGDAPAGGAAPPAPGRADARVPQPDGAAPRVARREGLLRQPRRQMRRRLQRTRRRLEQGHALRVPRRIYGSSVAPRAPVLAQTLTHHRTLFFTARRMMRGWFARFS